MRKLVALTCLITVFLWGEHRTLNEKLIVSYSTDKQAVQDDLFALKVYFSENDETRILQEKYHLQSKLERLDSYTVLVIYPITSHSLRNELILSLSPLFNDMFSIQYKADTLDGKEIAVKKTAVTAIERSQNVKKTQVLKSEKKENDNTLQWSALLLLFVVGLILLIRNRKKLATLEEGQKDMQNNQEKIETEIHTMGAKNA